MNILIEFRHAPVECAVNGALTLCAVVSEWLSEGSVVVCSDAILVFESYMYRSIPGQPTELDVVEIRTKERWPDETFSEANVGKLQRLLARSMFYAGHNGSRVVYVIEEPQENAAIYAMFFLVVFGAGWASVYVYTKWRRPTYSAVAPLDSIPPPV